MVLWGIFIVVVVCGLLFCTWLAVRAKQFEDLRPPKTESKPVVLLVDNSYPSVPKTLKDVFKMGDLEFEKFSAALIIAKERDLTFYAHSGGKNDRGIDTRLRTIGGAMIAVQSKLYTKKNIGSPDVQRFLGAIKDWKCVYGYFVTTTKFTPVAIRVRGNNSPLLRYMDRDDIEWLLQHRRREIAEAYEAVKAKIEEDKF